MITDCVGMGLELVLRSSNTPLFAVSRRDSDLMLFQSSLVQRQHCSGVHVFPGAMYSVVRVAAFPSLWTADLVVGSSSLLRLSRVSVC